LNRGSNPGLNLGSDNRSADAEKLAAKRVDTFQCFIHNLVSPVQAVLKVDAPEARCNAGVAQLVERNLAKVEVASSRLVSRSSNKGKQAGKAKLPFLFGGFCLGSVLSSFVY
jgi:hypothetical protein